MSVKCFVELGDPFLHDEATPRRATRTPWIRRVATRVWRFLGRTRRHRSRRRPHRRWCTRNTTGLTAPSKSPPNTSGKARSSRKSCILPVAASPAPAPPCGLPLPRRGRSGRARTGLGWQPYAMISPPRTITAPNGPLCCARIPANPAAMASRMKSSGPCCAGIAMVRPLRGANSNSLSLLRVPPVPVSLGAPCSPISAASCFTRAPS